MPLFNLLLNFLLAIPLFIVNGFLGKWKLHSYSIFGYSEFGFESISEDNFSENFFQMIVHPSVYLALVGWILQLLSFNDVIPSLWLLVPFYWVLRVVHSILRDTFAFTNWYTQFQACFISVLLSECTLFLIILPLLNDNASIFIDAEAFRDAFWYAALIYFSKFVWDLVKEHLVGETLFPSEKKAEVIIRRFHYYQHKYDEYIQYILNKNYSFNSSNQQNHFISLLYAIMIYEAHNRPFWARMLEYCVKIVNPFRTMSLGIMQVKTRSLISNRTSISLAINKLYSVFSTVNIYRKVELSIYDYNPSSHYYEQVSAIYDEIYQYLNLPPLESHKVKVTKQHITHSKKV